MTTQEIIKGLQNVLDYCRYHQDAPALRETIEMLKCSEIPNSSDERTDKRTGTHACDCISRQEAIDAIDKALSRTFTEPCGEMILKGLPSAQPEQRWIPCSERLPEVNEKPYYIDPIDGDELFESEQVLVFGKNDNGYDYSVASHIYSTESGDEWGNAYDSAEVELTTILAWMPLPEPYKERREG